MVSVYVSVGSNIEREKNVRSAIAALREQFGELTLSTVYDCKAVGFDGDDFYNLVVGFETDDGVQAVAQLLQEIEVEHGRTRNRQRFVSRTLDLDLLLYGNLILKDDVICLPREEITRYAFVLAPLAEIAGERRHPMSGKRLRDMWAAFDGGSQVLRPVQFDWELPAAAVATE
ncbi:MAG: 2-amino-4-hydroxy-6-hydroxymethyldihydropteridine diphosphokinase [Gammaproteobacteria bacterium]|nr:2-amino-4-hydroxy-6-hydroxymethyldihydropteridine diphosphokinase [Gammaproteobacteria bacterium]